jgi:hypothetical protein
VSPISVTSSQSFALRRCCPMLNVSSASARSVGLTTRWCALSSASCRSDTAQIRIRGHRHERRVPHAIVGRAGPGDIAGAQPPCPAGASKVCPAPSFTPCRIGLGDTPQHVAATAPKMDCSSTRWRPRAAGFLPPPSAPGVRSAAAPDRDSGSASDGRPRPPGTPWKDRAGHISLASGGSRRPATWSARRRNRKYSAAGCPPAALSPP